MRARANALRRRRSARNDEGMFQPRRCDREAAVGARALVSVMRVRRGQGPQCGVQHPLTRPRPSRSGSLRFNACGDCALCGNQFDSCKAHPRNRKPRPQRGHKAEQGGIVHSRTTVIPMTETIPRATVTRRPSCWVPISHASPALVSVFAIAPITIPVVATSGEIVPSAASRLNVSVIASTSARPEKKTPSHKYRIHRTTC